MDIDSYIAKHSSGWSELDRACRKGGRGLARRNGEEIERVVRLYQRASTHLAEVQTIYADARLERYLTAVVGRAYAALYAGRARRRGADAGRLAARYIASMRRTLPYAGVAAVVLFGLSAVILLWVANSPEAQAGVLPPQARAAIEQASGAPADHGISSGSLSSFILINNVYVTILAFALGITFGIGTVYILVQNAMLLGSLAGGFHAIGNAGAFWPLVLPHGLLELAAVCVGAGAGLRIGWSLVDPGDKTRSASLSEAAADAVIVLMGTIPALGIAAFVEGFVTGRTGNAMLEIAIGVVLAVLYLAAITGRIGAAISLVSRKRRPAFTASQAP